MTEVISGIVPSPKNSMYKLPSAALQKLIDGI